MIDQFKSTISKRGGLSKTNRFEVLIHLPQALTNFDRGRDLSLLCESTFLPGKQITSTEYTPGFGFVVKIPTGFIIEDVSFVFNITNDYYAKKVFDQWQNIIIDPVRYLVAYDNEFKTNVTIRQLDEENKPIYEVVFVEAYPVSVNTISLDNNAVDVVQKMSVTFTCAGYKVNSIN